MDGVLVGAASSAGLIWAIAVLVRRRSRRRAGSAPRKPQRIGSVGPGAAGAFYELLDEEKRKAIEIIVEDRAGYADPETRDGTMPEFRLGDRLNPVNRDRGQ